MNNIVLFEATQGPNFKDLTDLIMSWVNPIITLICIIVAIIATIALIINGVKIIREKDPNARQEHMKSLGYWFLGLVIVGVAVLAVNTIFPLIFSNTQLDIGNTN